MTSIDLCIYKTGMLKRTTSKSSQKNDFEFWRVIQAWIFPCARDVLRVHGGVKDRGRIETPTVEDWAKVLSGPSKRNCPENTAQKLTVANCTINSLKEYYSNASYGRSDIQIINFLVVFSTIVTKIHLVNIFSLLSLYLHLRITNKLWHFNLPC